MLDIVQANFWSRTNFSNLAFPDVGRLQNISSCLMVLSIASPMWQMCQR